MVIGIQESLFAEPDVPTTARSLTSGMSRTVLPQGAWVDVRPGWLSNSLPLFDRLSNVVAWKSERRKMYDSVVDVPRLTRFYGEHEMLPDPILDNLRDDLSARYREVLPEGFSTAGLCLYRDGDDSVAWHGDRFGRGADHDTVVAIVSLGAPRVLALRPRGGGAAIRFTLSGGDLLVMGGSCQRTWDHAVPKMAGAGPRMSIQFRPSGVR